MRHRLTFLLCAALAAPVAAQVRLVEAGIVCPTLRDGDRRPAPDTQAGFVRMVDGITIDVPGRTVPLIPDLGFGIRLATLYDAPRDVTMVTRHPPMGPDGVTVQTHPAVLPAAGAVYARTYSFDYDYEMLPGTWTLAVEDGEETLLSVDFEIVASAPMPAACTAMLQS